MNIAVLISGGGTNLAALIAASKDKVFLSHISLVVSNQEEAYGLVRAKEAGIPVAVVSHKDPKALLDLLHQHHIDWIILAGYLKKIPELLLEQYPRRIINIHPSLLPAHGGPGMYGLRVHQSVLDSGDKVTGATVHYVSEDIDRGEILLQKSIEVPANVTAKELQQLVLVLEHELLPEAVAHLEEKFTAL